LEVRVVAVVVIGVVIGGVVVIGVVHLELKYVDQLNVELLLVSETQFHVSDDPVLVFQLFLNVRNAFIEHLNHGRVLIVVEFALLLLHLHIVVASWICLDRLMLTFF